MLSMEFWLNEMILPLIKNILFCSLPSSISVQNMNMPDKLNSC